MPAEDNRRFVIRDRNWHPKALTPDYKTSIARSPRQALVSIPQSISETTGPDFSHLKFAEHDNDLLLNFNNGGLPIGERIIVSGRVMDQYGKPIPHINPAIKYPRLCCVGDTWMPEIRTDSLRGHAMDALLVSPYLGPEMHILIPRIASRHIPEAGAVCGSSARTDLCGGAAGNCRPYRDRLSNTGPRP